MKLLINHIAKIIFVVVLLYPALYAQQIDTTNTKEEVKFEMQKSPWGAVLRSAVIPGWGQFYNESYLKIPVIWGVGAWLIYNWIDNNNLYHDYRKLYIQNSNIPQYRKDRDFYHDQRDLFAIYMGITYILNLVDAYVDAHLFDFTVEEDYLTRSPRLGVKFNF